MIISKEEQFRPYRERCNAWKITEKERNDKYIEIFKSPENNELINNFFKK
jgi:hypothetical protein